MKKQRKFINRYFKCPECNTVISAPKKLSMASEKGHIKTMYCYICKRKRDFIMIDSDIAR